MVCAEEGSTTGLIRPGRKNAYVVGSIAFLLMLKWASLRDVLMGTLFLMGIPILVGHAHEGADSTPIVPSCRRKGESGAMPASSKDVSRSSPPPEASCQIPQLIFSAGSIRGIAH